MSSGGGEVGSITFETNIKAVAAEIAAGMAQISRTLEAEMAKGSAGNPSGAATSGITQQLAQVRDLGRQQIEQINRSFLAEGQRSAASGTPFVNPDPTGKGRPAGAQIQEVLTLTSQRMQQTLTAVPETIRNATGGFQTLAKQEVGQMLRELETLFKAVNTELTAASANPLRGGVPAASVGGSTTQAVWRAEAALSNPIPPLSSDPALLAASINQKARDAEQQTAGDNLARAQRLLTQQVDRMAITVEEATAAVDAGLPGWSRLREGTRTAGFKMPDPNTPGGSLYADIVPAQQATEMQAYQPEYLRQVTSRTALQQEEPGATSEAGKQAEYNRIYTAALKENAQRQRDYNKVHSDALKENEAFDKRYAKDQTQTYDQTLQAQNRNVGNQQYALGTELSNQRLSGDATSLGGGVFQMRDGSFVKRLDSETARQITALGELTDAELQLKAMTEKGALATGRQADVAAREPQGLLQGFKGGFFSRGFNAGGDATQGFTQDITNLAGTAGVLAKYSLAGQSVQFASKALADLKQGTIEYTDQLVNLNQFLDTYNQGLSDTAKASVDLGDAQNAGLVVAMDFNTAIGVGTQALATYQEELRQGANANTIFQESIKQTGVNVLITGQKADVAAKQLQAATESFGTGSGGQSQINDAIINAHKNLGGDSAAISEVLASAGPLAQQGGISPELLANMASIANARTNQSSSQIATTLERLVSRSENAQFTKALAGQGITNTGNVGQELEKLSAAYQKMNPSAQVALETQLGSARALTVLVPWLQHFNEVSDNTSKSLSNVGAGEAFANDKLTTFAGQLADFGATLKTLMVDIGTSGIFAPLGVALGLLAPPLRIVTAAMDDFDKLLPGVGRNVLGLALDAGLFTLAMHKLAASNLESSETATAAAAANKAHLDSEEATAAAADATAAALAKKAEMDAAEGESASLAAEYNALLNAQYRAQAVVTAALAAETRGLAAARAAAAASGGKASLIGGGAIGVGQGVSRVTTDAEIAQGATADELAVVKGGGGAAAGGLFGLGTLATAGIVAGGLAMVAVGEKAVNLAYSLHGVDTAIDKINTGSAKDMQDSIDKLASARADLNKDSSGFLGTIVNFAGGDPAKAKREDLTDWIKELRAEQAANAATPGLLDPGGLTTVQDLTSRITDLKATGASTSAVINQLVSTLNDLTGASQRAASKVAPGSLLLDRGAAGLVQDQLNAFQTTPVGKISAADDLDLAFNHLKDLQGFKSPPTQVSSDPNSDVVLGKYQLSAQQRAAGAKAVNDTLAALGKGVGDVLTPQQMEQLAAAEAASFHVAPALTEVFRKFLLARMQAATSPPLTAATLNLPGGHELFKGAVDSLVSEQGTAVSQANARGASSEEMLKTQQSQYATLAATAKTVKDAGVDPTTFDNLIQALAVKGKDTFTAFVTRVDQLKTLADATADPAQRAAIDHEVAVLEATANGIDPSLLPAGFTLASLPGMIKKAQANQLAKDQQVLAAAKAADLAIINALDDRLVILEDLSINAGAIRKIEADIAAAKAKMAGEKLPTDPVTDPSFADTHTTNTTPAPSDTAAQIAAAQAAASIFPGDKVGAAAAAVRTAAANLDATAAKDGTNTVAYWNAVGTLHQAQQTYADALLAAQDTSRLVNIDRTNPLLVARDKIVTATAKLRQAEGAHADSQTINEDKIAVKDAQNAAEQTAFSQKLADAQLSEQLGRTSHAAYLSYLQNEHNRLAVIRVKTYQQQQELNQIDQAIKAASDQMAGQFNLGAIKVPTIYEVRRAIANQHLASGGDTGYQDNRVVTITVNGGDVAKLTTLLKDSLGTTATSRITVAPRKS